MIKLFLMTKATEKLAVIVQNGKAAEIAAERPGSVSLVGYLFKGKVKRINKGLQAAFIDIGEDKLAFLQKHELPIGRKNPQLPIEKIIHEGQSILVQVQKDAHGDKGANLTANVTLPGLHVVYLPEGGYTAVSKQIAEPERTNWKTAFERLLQEGEGVIVRTSAQAVTMEELGMELEQKRREYQKVLQLYEEVQAGRLVIADPVIPNRMLRLYSGKAAEIIADDAQMAAELRKNYPALAERISWEKEIEELLPAPVSAILDEATRPIIAIDRGITLHIETTETCTVIDVNSAGYQGKSNKEQTALIVNQYAAKAIASQLRLRNVSGMILIDFIRMRGEKEQQEVIRTLKDACREDAMRTEIYGFTRLGMLEMTRKRERPSHQELFTKQTPPQLSDETLAYQLERELLARTSAEDMVIEASESLLHTFLATTKHKHLLDAYAKINDAIAAYQIYPYTEAEQNKVIPIDNLF